MYACYRFAAKLREHKPILDATLARLVASLSVELPEYGQDICIDASDLPAYPNGQRFLSKNGPERERYSDPRRLLGASERRLNPQGRRLLRIQASRGGLLAHRASGRAARRDGLRARGVARHDLLKRVRELKVSPATVAMDKGYDTQPVHDACRDAGCLPVIPLKATLGVKRGEHKPPTCEHGVWTFAGADLKRGMTKWRCPSAECKPASLWRKASRLHPLIPRDSKRFGDLYRGR